MKDYKIKIALGGFYLLRILIAALLMVIIMSFLRFFNLKNINSLLIIIPFATIFYIVFLITKKWFTINCTIISSDDKVKINYFFIRNKSCEFKIDDIKTYALIYDQYYNVFTVRLKKNKKIKLLIYNDDLISMDNFLDFFDTFENKIEKLNKINKIYLSIRKKLSFYKTKTAFYLSIFILIVLILIPFLVIFCKSKINLGSMIILYSSFIYFILRVYRERKKY